MPAKFVVQRLREVERSEAWSRSKDTVETKIWSDTNWPTLSMARSHYPEDTFREVMTEW